MTSRVWLGLSVAFGLVVAGCADGGTGTTRDGGTGPRGEGGIDSGPGCRTDDDCPDDGFMCNGILICRDGLCIASGIPTCNDGVTCTRDSCLTDTDECQNIPDDTACPDGLSCYRGVGCSDAPACEFDSDCASDGVFCNGDEVCVTGRCRSPGTRTCGDTNSCATGECVESTMACTSTVFPDVLTNVMHCGSGANDCVVCPEPAPTLNQVASCVGGACGVECASGFGDADGNMANGCECMAAGSVDVPDPGFVDSNCDGIDGDVAIGIFVAPLVVGGNDLNPGTMEMPVATITRGIELARTSMRARAEVYVAAGTYDESITLSNGVSIFGGYNAVSQWRRSMSFVSQINGGTTAVQGTGITAPLEVQLMTIVSATATATGESSYGVRVANSTALVTLRLNTIRAGSGAAGSAGTHGSTGATGDTGRPGHNGCNGCSGFPCGAMPCSTGGGSACAPGGRGGDGGHAGNGGSTGTAGSTGSASGVGGPAGTGGGAAAICFDSSSPGLAPTANGGPGSDGSNGAAPTLSVGTASAGLYSAATGTNGTTGTHGGGGGGGGGAGGGRETGVCNADRGGGGGGGGGAGCAGSAGTGGTGGGGSFAVFASAAQLEVANNTLTSTSGGVGGRGGNGGGGGGGGNGGNGGSGADDAAGGGNGAPGGRGGHSGSGSGGPGGPSYGIFSVASAVTNAGNAITVGTPGAGGAGGTGMLGSAPAGLVGAAGTAFSM